MHRHTLAHRFGLPLGAVALAGGTSMACAAAIPPSGEARERGHASRLHAGLELRLDEKHILKAAKRDEEEARKLVSEPLCQSNTQP
jgi:hypothetical protein